MIRCITLPLTLRINSCMANIKIKKEKEKNNYGHIHTLTYLLR